MNLTTLKVTEIDNRNSRIQNGPAMRLSTTRPNLARLMNRKRPRCTVAEACAQLKRVAADSARCLAWLG